MTEWFDTWSLTYPEKRSDMQIEGLREAVGFIRSIIAEELATGIPPERIFLGGISQGCATALHVLLSSETRLGGFIGMSGWMPFESSVRGVLQERGSVREGDKGETSKNSVTKAINFVRTNLSIAPLDASAQPPECVKTPVYLCHGDCDQVVDYELGRKIYNLLKGLGMDPITWENMEGFGHWYKVPETIDSIIEFWGTKSDFLPS